MVALDGKSCYNRGNAIVLEMDLSRIFLLFSGKRRGDPTNAKENIMKIGVIGHNYTHGADFVCGNSVTNSRNRHTRIPARFPGLQMRLKMGNTKKKSSTSSGSRNR